jgi:hypothetical protein
MKQSVSKPLEVSLSSGSCSPYLLSYLAEMWREMFAGTPALIHQ